MASHDRLVNNSQHVIKPGRVLSNTPLCDEHFRLTLLVDSFPHAQPGQFLHLGPQLDDLQLRHDATPMQLPWSPQPCEPLLRRAFSIAGLRRTTAGVELDVIYRVVGTSTGWLSRLIPGNHASVLGPQGNRFPMQPGRPHAWLVAGGVGLPPLLWFSEELSAHRESGGLAHVVFFYGAQKASLSALRIDAQTLPATDACSATLASVELAGRGIPLVLSTDDGSLGFRGHVGQALDAYWAANSIPGEQLALYTCGPERMMAYVAKFADRVGAICFACVERSMACATGMCQSCVVPVHDAADADGWTYRLCCTDGPIFDTRDIIWDFEAFRTSKSACA